MTRRFALACALGLALAAAPVAAPARAACPPPGSPRRELARHALVFVGTVTALRDSAGRDGARLRRVQVHLHSIWKGSPARTFALGTTGPKAAGAVALSVGETYVVYADSLDGQPWIPPCGRTRPLSAASRDVNELGRPTPIAPLPRASRLPR